MPHQKIVRISGNSDRIIIILSLKKCAHCVMSFPPFLLFIDRERFLNFRMPSLLSLCFIFDLLLKLNRKDYSEKNYTPICAREFSSFSETFSSIWESSFLVKFLCVWHCAPDMVDLFYKCLFCFCLRGYLVRIFFLTIWVELAWMWVNFNSLQGE